MVKSRSYIATPPGATIREQLDSRGMSQKEFSIRMSMSEKHISKLINGDVQLTKDVAFRLEMVLGLPAQFWNDLERIYREKLVKAIAENEMDDDIIIAKKFPYNEMSKYNWVPPARTPQEKVLNLRKFFEVVRLDIAINFRINRIACRRLSDTEKADYALVAWSQAAKLEARKREVKPINIKKLSESIPEIRAMTRLTPETFCPKMTKLLADCGVALIFLPHIGGSFLHGATFYAGKKIVMGLTVRGRYADIFWFSLFHEIAHILYGHIGQDGGTSENDELSADLFARDTLIPEPDFKCFVSRKDFSDKAILSFAKSLDIDPGILVGRLQKDGAIKYSWHNDLKTQYTIPVVGMA